MRPSHAASATRSGGPEPDLGNMATTGTGPHRAPRKTPTCPVNIYVAFFRAECRDGGDPYTAADTVELNSVGFPTHKGAGE